MLTDSLVVSSHCGDIGDGARDEARDEISHIM